MLFDPVTRHSLEDGTGSIEDNPLQGTNVNSSIPKGEISSYESRLDEIRHSLAQHDHVAGGNLHSNRRFKLAQPKLDAGLKIPVCRRERLPMNFSASTWSPRPYSVYMDREELGTTVGNLRLETTAHELIHEHWLCETKGSSCDSRVEIVTIWRCPNELCDSRAPSSS